MAFKGSGRPPQYRVGKERVPGVTTVLGQFMEPGGLVHWAFKQGQANPMASNPYDKSDDAMDAGSVAHAMVERWIHEEDPYEELAFLDNRPDVKALAQQAFASFLEWYNSSGIRITATEVSLTCADHLYGGTIDAIGVDSQGRVVLLEWKTGNSLYIDNLLQIGAYAQMWESAGRAPIKGYHLCRFGKEHADFAHHYFEELEEAKELFNLLAHGYQIKKRLKKRI